MTDDDKQCSTCDNPAEWEIRDAHPDKGNLTCTLCLNRFWPMARVKRVRP